MYCLFRRRCFATLQFLGTVSIHPSIIHPSTHPSIHPFVPPFTLCLRTLHCASIQNPPKYSLSTHLEHSKVPNPNVSFFFFPFFASHHHSPQLLHPYTYLSKPRLISAQPLRATTEKRAALDGYSLPPASLLRAHVHMARGLIDRGVRIRSGQSVLLMSVWKSQRVLVLDAVRGPLTVREFGMVVPHWCVCVAGAASFGKPEGQMYLDEVRYII